MTTSGERNAKWLVVGIFVLLMIYGRARVVVAGGLIVRGDLYTSNPSSDVIEQYSANGTYLSSYTVPSIYGSQVRGLAVGPNGLLYAVTWTSPEGAVGVVAIDSNGIVEQTYSGPGDTFASIANGQIAFAKNGDFFVAADGDLDRFSPGSPTGTVVYTNNQVYGIASLPSGDLLVLSAYQLQEITTDGTVVRTITPSVSLGLALGVAYDAATNDIYVSMLGYTNEFDQLMQINGTTGQVENQITYGATDLFLTSDSRLLAGNRSVSPEIFDLNLNQIGTLNNGQQMFVTQATVPEPSSIVLLAFGGVAAILLQSKVRFLDTFDAVAGRLGRHRLGPLTIWQSEFLPHAGKNEQRRDR